MAYITTEQVKEKRELLKAAFPSKEGWKLSITREHHSGIRVEILEAPIDFTPALDGRKYAQVNTYHIDSHYGEEHPQLAKVLNKILSIIDKGNYNNSDLMADYHEVGFYSWINIGAWDKPFQYNPKEVKASAPVAAPAAENTPEVAPAQTGNIQFVDYSDKAFAVIGEGTKKVKDVLKELGGKPNWNLKGIGFGWIFSKRHMETVQTALINFSNK